MSPPEAINADPEFEIQKFSDKGIEVWYQYKGVIPLSFVESGEVQGRVSLKFLDGRLSQIRVYFLESSSVEEVAAAYQAAHRYLSDAADSPPNPELEQIDLAEELRRMDSILFHPLADQGTVNVNAQKSDEGYQCSISIHPNRAARSWMDDPNAISLETIDYWSIEKLGDSEVSFQTSLAMIRSLHSTPMATSGPMASALRFCVVSVHDRADGQIRFSYTLPIEQSWKRSFRAAVRAIEQRHHGLPENRSVKFGFIDSWESADGPASALASALLLESLISGFEIPENLAVTGDLDAAGKVIPVDAIADKVRSAMAIECDLIGVPAANEEDLQDLAVEDKLSVFLAANIFTISSLDEALKLANPELRSAQEMEALEEFARLRAELAEAGADGLYAEGTKARLESILEPWPNLFSAKILLEGHLRQLPKTLSQIGTLSRLQQIMTPFRLHVEEVENGLPPNHFRGGGSARIEQAKELIAELNQHSNANLAPLMRAEASLISHIQSLTQQDPSGEALKELQTLTKNADSSWKTILSDPAVQAQIQSRGFDPRH